MPADHTAHMIHTCLLPERALFSLSGADSLDFLHNLITCDVMKLEEGDVTFGALLTPQGKVMFDFHILRRSDGFVFDVPNNQRDALMKRLGFYKLRAAVDIEPIDDLRVFARWGEQDVGDGRRPEMGERIYLPSTETNAEVDDFTRHRIAVGVPQSGADFELGAVFPHDALMDQFDNGGVDFAKGCYVGQEVVSRMKHRDSARNRFVKVTGETLPENGSELLADDRVVGHMGGSCGGGSSGGGSAQREGLALVRIDKVGKALADGKQVMGNGHSVSLNLPDFVTFGWSKP